MKVNLLQGTSTPTLTPMPGVHKALHRIAARWQFLLKLKVYGWAARGELGRSPFASLRENGALSGSCLPSAPLRENQALETDPPSGDRSAPR